jgi:predicted urease superfamily metal-dependent hydrolase
MNDWREPRPISQDPRLTDVQQLVRHYRNMMIEADFNDDPSYPHWKLEYERVKLLHDNGVYYEPNF